MPRCGLPVEVSASAGLLRVRTTLHCAPRPSHAVLRTLPKSQVESLARDLRALLWGPLSNGVACLQAAGTGLTKVGLFWLPPPRGRWVDFSTTAWWPLATRAPRSENATNPAHPPAAVRSQDAAKALNVGLLQLEEASAQLAIVSADLRGRLRSEVEADVVVPFEVRWPRRQGGRPLPAGPPRHQPPTLFPRPTRRRCGPLAATEVRANTSRSLPPTRGAWWTRRHFSCCAMMRAAGGCPRSPAASGGECAG